MALNNIPENALQIINKLNNEGFEAFLVGGCVRDMILDRIPSDWDVTTNATPEQIKSLFIKTIDTGIKHGTVCVVINGEHVEVTTYRIDGIYNDNRRPSSVTFTSQLREDLSRRDFTINALAYHPQTGIIDYFDGLKHIEQRLITTVGIPNARFSEDALRMLRAVRFSAQLGFEIDGETYQAIIDNKQLISSISAERIRDELTKLLVSSNPLRFNILYRTGLLDYFMTEMAVCFETVQNHSYHIYNVGEHSLHAAEGIEADALLRWTILLHDIGKPQSKSTDSEGIDHFYGHQQVGAKIAGKILARLRFDNASIKKITTLIMYHDIDIDTTERGVRKAINKVGPDIFPDLLKVQRADKMAQNPRYIKQSMDWLNKVEEIYNKIKELKQCLCINDMAITGEDLKSLGMTEGKELGDMLKYLFHKVLEKPELNNRQDLIMLVKRKL